jgi:hypothetical protein
VAATWAGIFAKGLWHQAASLDLFQAREVGIYGHSAQPTTAERERNSFQTRSASYATRPRRERHTDSMQLQFDRGTLVLSGSAPDETWRCLPGVKWDPRIAKRLALAVLLIIETMDKSIEQVRQFKQLLKEALSHSFREDAEFAEKRFEVLSALVKKLSSQASAERSWRALVLDVRQHVEFVARELDREEREVEVYRSGAGKSGGQRQKLAATVAGIPAACRSPGVDLRSRGRALAKKLEDYLPHAFHGAPRGARDVVYMRALEVGDHHRLPVAGQRCAQLVRREAEASEVDRCGGLR